MTVLCQACRRPLDEAQQARPRGLQATRIHHDGRARRFKVQAQLDAEPTMLTRHDLARLLGCSIDTIRRRERAALAGRDREWTIPDVSAHGRPRYLRTDALAFLARRRGRRAAV